MKEIRILNGNITSIIPVEDKIQRDKVKYDIDVALSTKTTFDVRFTDKYVTYPYLFLANSVIEYPKFD